MDNGQTVSVPPVRKQRLAFWRHALPERLLEDAFASEHSADVCQAVFAALPRFADKAEQVAVQQCLRQALRKQEFLKRFASFYCKALLSDKSGALTAAPGAVLVLSAWAAALLQALDAEAALAKAAAPKVLQAAGDAVATLAQPQLPPSRAEIALRRLAAALRGGGAVSAAASDLAGASPATAAGGAVAAALLVAKGQDGAVRGTVSSAYVNGVVGSKERLSDAAVHAWTLVAARLTADEVAAAVDKLGTMARRSAETALANARGVFAPGGAADLSPAAPAAALALLPLLRHSKEPVAEAATEMVVALAARLRHADALAAAAATIVGVLDGSTEGQQKAKSAKERAAFARLAHAMCPEATDLARLRALAGDVRGATLRVAAQLAACAQHEVTTDGKAAVLAASEAWALAGCMHALHSDSRDATDAAACSSSAGAVVDAAAAAAAAKEAEVRRAGLGAAAALALDAAQASALAPLATAAAAVARDGAPKAALRSEAVAALAAAAGAAAAERNDAAPAWQLFAGGAKAPAAPLLTPTALASVGSNGAYAAAAAAAVATAAPSQCIDDPTLGVAFAALLLGNAQLPRAAALPLLRHACMHPPRPSLASATLASLQDALDSFPAIATTEVVTGTNETAQSGARVLAPRVLHAAAALAPLAASDATLAMRLLVLLHHPVATALRRGSHSSAPAQHLLRQHGLATESLLSTSVGSLGATLKVSAPEAHSDAARAAAQRAIATALAMQPQAVWPGVLERLRELLQREEVESLQPNDIRIFKTPRGRLMVEEFGSQLSPDELFATGSRAVAARDAGAENGAKKAAKGGKKGAGLSKEEQQRQDQLAAEEAVRQDVDRIRQQLQLGCGLLAACARAAPDAVCAATSDVLPLVLPLLRTSLVAEAARDDAAAAEVGAFSAVAALADTLPMRGASHQIAAALQAAATGTPGGDPMRLAVHPAMTSAVRAIAAHVDAHGALGAPSYALVFPMIEAVLQLPSASTLHSKALAVASAHVDGGVVSSSEGRALLLRHITLARHLLTAAPRYIPDAQAILAQLLPCVHDARTAGAAASALVAGSAEARKAALAAAATAGVYSASDDGTEPAALLHAPEPLSCLWVVRHDADDDNVAAAARLWEDAGDPAVQSADFVTATAAHLSNPAPAVREAAARAAVAAAAKDPALVAQLASIAMAAPAGAPPAQRAGCALAVREIAAVLGDADCVLELMRFVLSKGLPDGVGAVRSLYVEAGSALVDAHGASQLQTLMPLIEDYLDNPHGLPEDVYDQVRTGAAVFLSGMAQHLPKDDPKIASIVAILKDILNTPSSVVQETASTALTPIAPKLAADEAQVSALVQYFLSTATEGERYSQRRGAAFGLAGLVKGLGISALKKQGIMEAIKGAVDGKSSGQSKEGGLMMVECLCMKLGRMFEPYLISVLPLLLAAFGDGKAEVRDAADAAARAVMANISGPGVKLVLPTLLKGLSERAWRSKQASIQLLGAMSNCAPQQLATSLPTVVPALAGVLGDAHAKVQAAAKGAIEMIGSAVRNPEVRELSGALIKAIADPVKATRPALAQLRDTVFVHTVDVSSLALILPVVTRGMKERTGESKKHAARILGNLASLVANPRDLAPYMPTLLPEIKTLLVDPLPEVRATSARALGALVRGLGPDHVEGMLPWLLATLSSEASSVERSGAALGLAEIVAVLGEEHLGALLPGVIAGCRDRSAAVRDGNLTLLVHLPVTCKRAFEPHLEATLPCVLEGLADEAEEVRTTAMAAATKVVELYAATRSALLLPVLEVGLQEENWRIRESSVKLLGELLYKIAGTSGRVKLDGGDDDEGAATESYAIALLETLGEEARNDVLARLYLVRNDSSFAVRTAAVHVWKSVVVNTPKTLKAVMPRLLDISIEAIASRGEERQAMASRCLGELVRKMGNQVLGIVVPILVDTMSSDSADIRAGVCLALKEILEAMTHEQLPAIMPAIQAALCDPDEGVREAAGDAFAVLFKGGAGSLVEGMLPALLEGLGSEGKAAQSIKGLQVILGVRPTLLDRVLPKLLSLPLTEHKVRAVGPLLGQADSHHLTQHLSFALPRLLALPPTQRGNESLRAECHAAATAAAAAATEGAAVSELVRILLRHLDNESSRAAAAAVIRDWVAATKADIDLHKPILVSSLVELFGEADEANPDALPTIWAAAKAVLATIDKQELPSYVSALRKALSSAYDAARRNTEVGDEVQVPGLCLPRALEPLVEVYLQGLLHATSTDVREAAAAGLGEAVSSTSAAALKPFVVKITGPLIRIVGDRFPPPVKVAILRSLGLVIAKAGAGLKPFVPQLQTTFLKCLPDPVEEIRLQAASNLGGLAALMTARVDQLALDLSGHATSADTSLKRAYLLALRGVLANAAAKLTAASLPSVGAALRQLVPKVGADDEDLQVALAACMGEYCGAAPDDDSSQMLRETALQDPLPAAPPLSTVHAVVLPVICRAHADRLQALDLLDAAIAAAVRMSRHKEFATKVAAVRAFGRLVAWGTQAGCRERVLPPLVGIVQTTLAPDQDRALQAETVHQLKALAALEHESADDLARELAQELLPALCSVITSASGTALVTTERCLAHLLRVHDGIAAAREIAAGPGMGGSVKAMLTEPYLKKLASMPLTSAFDATIDEEY